MRVTLEKKVKAVMHYGVITVPMDSTAADMCRVMSHNQVSCVAVANDAREVVGVVSSTDIMACGVKSSERDSPAWAEAIMTPSLLAVDADDSLQLAIEMMVEHHIHRVLVRADGHVVGILSTSDVVREIGKTVAGKPESVFTRMERFEDGMSGSGETEVAKETVFDVMTHGVLMIPPTLTLRETAKVISEKRVHRVIVASDEGEMIGVVAAIDILKPWTGDHDSVARDDVIAADVMTQNIEAVEHWRTLDEAMERMAGKHIHALLVLRARGEISGELAARPIVAAGSVQGVNIPIGLISATDIVREIGKTMPMQESHTAHDSQRDRREEESMTWRSILEEEHRLLREVLEAAERECDCIDASGRCHIELVTDMIEFFRYFGDGLHDPKEDGLLYSRLRRRGMTRDLGPLEQLLGEHEWSHGQLDVLQDTVEAVRKGDSGLVPQLSTELREYIEVMRRHVDVEETVFFDLVSRHLNQTDLVELSQEFNVVHDDEAEEGVQAFYERLAHRVLADEREICG